MRIDLYQDGACWNKEGYMQHMGIGVAVYIDGTYEPDLSRAIYACDEKYGSNNIAEWIACVTAMEIATDLRKHYPEAVIHAYSDSQIIVNQFNGEYQIKQLQFLPYHKRATEMGNRARVALSWVPREQNKQADELSKIGLHGTREDSPHHAKYKRLC